MSKVDDELTRLLRRAERPMDGDALFEAVARRRLHHERVRRVQSGLLAFSVLAATTGAFVALRAAFEGNLDAGNETELPTNGRIVFASDVQVGDRQNVHLFSMEPDISAPMQLTEGNSGNYSPDVSPDGRTIAFTHESYDSSEVVIATMSIDGSRPTRLTDPELVASNPAWSPDGTKIAFTGGRKQTQRIFVMNADGSNPHPITDEGIFLPEDPAWSPDGSLIAFRGSATPPIAPEGPSAWDIYTIEPDGQGPTNITNSPALESQPVWSRDGERIAYQYDYLPDKHVLDIVVRRLSDGTETFLTVGPQLDSDPVWSPDGRFVVFSRQPVVNGRHDLWRIRADGTALTMLITEGHGPSWQPIPQTTVTPSPLMSPSPEPERDDLGFGFDVCEVSQVQGQFDGVGAMDTAFVAIERGGGGCPSVQSASAHVGIDLDEDGLVDATYGPIACEVYYCRAFAAPDLDGDDNRRELFVVESAGTIVGLGVYALEAEAGSPGNTEVVRIRIGEPDLPQNGFVTGDPARLFIGGDEGWSYRLRCEDHGVNRFIYQQRAFRQVDSAGPATVDETTVIYYQQRLDVFDAREPEQSTSDDPLGPQPAEVCGAPIPTI